MEAVQIQLPPLLVQRVKQEMPPDAVLSQVIIEAVQMWLERRRQQRQKNDQVLQALRQKGIVMTADEQRAMAESIMSTLSVKETPDRDQVRSSLSKFAVPLSAEIIAMRGER